MSAPLLVKVICWLTAVLAAAMALVAARNEDMLLAAAFLVFAFGLGVYPFGAW